MRTSPVEQPSAVGGDLDVPVLSPGGTLGNAIDASADARAAQLTPAQLAAIVHSVGATLAHQLVLGQHQNFEGPLPAQITLEEDTTRLYVLVNGDGEIQTITPAGGATTAGRVALLYVVGSGVKTVKQSFSGGGIGRLLTPENVDILMPNRSAALLIGDGANGWLCLPLSAAAQRSTAIGSMRGLQIDAAAAALPVALTGAEQGENFRRNTRQTVASASGTIDVLLAKDTTILVVQSVGDVTLRTLGNDASGDGRELQIEHERSSGSGLLTIPHNTAGTYLAFFNSNQTAMVMGVGIAQFRSRSGFWRPILPGHTTPAQLGPIESNKAIRFVFHVPYLAGTGGAPRDVLVTLGETFNFRIVKVESMVNTPIAASTGHLRSASAGAGSALSFNISTATAGTTAETNRSAPNNVVAGTPIYWRLSDGAVAGDLMVNCIRY